VELSGDRPVVVIGRDFAYMTTGRLKGVALWIEASSVRRLVDPPRGDL